MAIVRVYLFTYKRNYLLPRAIQSLVNQTFKNWVCEIHNNDPEDSYPAKYVASLNDSRFIIKDHAVNLGGNVSFNLAFAGCSEKYASILEDDNWWEPSFLDEMVGLMEDKPYLDIAWSNMRLWQEGDNNTWTDTGKTVWPTQQDKLFKWPHPEQALGALHSTGAMIYKTSGANNYLLPGEALFDGMEAFRERTFKHPIYMYSKVVANFSITATTNRSVEKWKWTVCKILQLSSFIIASEKKEEVYFDLLNFYRKQNPGVVTIFFLVNVFYIKDKSLLKYFTISDWYPIVKWLIKNNIILFEIKKQLVLQAAVYNFLLINTRNRFIDSAGD